VRFLGHVPYQEILGFYRGAEALVFPSLIETFGHPLLEAMASDVPVVAADIPVFREIAGDAAFFADPHDAESLARAMEEALFAPFARESLVKRGRERVREYTWDRSAQRLLALFHDVAEAGAVASRGRRAVRTRQGFGLLSSPGRANASARAALG
jgi:glycosyltransferase involved in cell wall biosynthesis